MMTARAAPSASSPAPTFPHALGTLDGGRTFFAREFIYSTLVRVHRADAGMPEVLIPNHVRSVGFLRGCLLLAMTTDLWNRNKLAVYFPATGRLICIRHIVGLSAVYVRPDGIVLQRTLTRRGRAYLRRVCFSLEGRGLGPIILPLPCVMMGAPVVM